MSKATRKRRSKGKEPASRVALFRALAATEPYLGHARAIVIVCGCADTSPANLSRTLSELGTDGIPFQKCVWGGVRHAGYEISMEDIPNGPDTRLIDVVSVIQNAPKAAAGEDE